MIENVNDEAVKVKLTKICDEVIKTLNKHIDTTDELINTLKRALEE